MGNGRVGSLAFMVAVRSSLSRAFKILIAASGLVGSQWAVSVTISRRQDYCFL